SSFSDESSDGLRARRGDHQEVHQEVLPECRQLEREKNAEDAWARTLRARRHERGCRFFGSSLLAVFYGSGIVSFCGLEGCPALVAFVLLELLVLVCFACAEGPSRKDGSGAEMMASLLGSAMGISATKGSQALVHLSTLVSMATEVWKILQDAGWFLFVLLLAQSVSELLLFTRFQIFS
ncbi:unnamed protein product, partial [Polarella glacialis]